MAPAKKNGQLHSFECFADDFVLKIFKMGGEACAPRPSPKSPLNLWKNKVTWLVDPRPKFVPTFPYVDVTYRKLIFG